MSFFTCDPNFKFVSLYEHKDTIELLSYNLDQAVNYFPIYNHKKVTLKNCDEGDEVVTPWPTGYVFDEATPREWIELLAELAKDPDYIVLGRTSDVNGDFADKYEHWEDRLNLIYKVDTTGYQGSIYCTKKHLERNFRYGFYPNYATLMGPLPRCIIWKCFKVR